MSIAVLGILGEGLMFAHLLELQHQCLHNTATGWRTWDRIIGVLLGLPMLVSFSDRRKHHLHHHRYLGTPQDQEFFSYDYGTLHSWRGLTIHFLMVGHYAYVIKKVRQALCDRSDLEEEMLSSQARIEYALISLWVIGQLLAAVLGYVIVVRLCVLPLVVAIPCHVLIELPEHWGCQRTRDVMANTRTIRASKIAVWFTNGNNYHVEHHLCAGMPNDSLPDIHAVIRENIAYRNTSYWQFYWEFSWSFWKNALKKGASTT
jgi:fatty acid desaturase